MYERRVSHVVFVNLSMLVIFPRATHDDDLFLNLCCISSCDVRAIGLATTREFANGERPCLGLVSCSS